MEWIIWQWRKNSTAGFTLIELMITLGLLAVLIGIALPGFSEWQRNIRMDVTTRELIRIVQLAKVSAITHASLVTLCPSSDGAECTRNWQDGILVFEDVDGDRKLGDEEVLIRHHQFSGFNGDITWRAFQNRRYLQITAQGFTRYQNGNFTLCPADKNIGFARQIIINRTARIRHAVDSDGDGIREDSRGRPLRCS